MRGSSKVADYIRVYTEGRDVTTGFKLEIEIVSKLQFNLGIRTADLSLTSNNPGERLVSPISGNVQDYLFSFELIDDTTNKAFSIDNIGNETALNKITTSEQVNFLIASIMNSGLNLIFEIRNDWLGLNIFGFLRIVGDVEGDDFFTKVLLKAEFKQGVSFFEFT